MTFNQLSRLHLIALIGAYFVLAGSVEAWPQQVPSPDKSKQTRTLETSRTDQHVKPSNQPKGTNQTMATSEKAQTLKKGRAPDNTATERSGKHEPSWSWLTAQANLFNFLLVIFTAVLAISTSLLWWETKKAADAARESARATMRTVDLTFNQLRAYVSVNPGRFWELDPNHRTAMSYNILNTGETPAFNLRHGAVLRLAPFPLPQDFAFPQIKPGGGTPLGRNVGGLSGEASVDVPFTQDEIVTLLKGESPGTRVFLFGEVVYETLGEEHRTRFCFSLAGWFEAIPLAEQGDWTQLNNAIPRVNLMWHHDPTHNTAD